MIEMVHRFLRQKFSNAGVVIALSTMALFAAFQVASSGGQAGLEIAILPMLVLAAACVSRDASGGALQMILCRPIRRSDYLLGRYAGILAAYGAFLGVTAALGVVISRALFPLLGASPQPFDFRALAAQMAATLLGGIATAATILLLSTFLPGYGDVLGFILLAPLFALPDLLGQILKAPWLTKGGDALRRNLLPSLDWNAVLRGENPLGDATGRWVLAVVLYLVLALAIFSRREFAYGQD